MFDISSIANLFQPEGTERVGADATKPSAEARSLFRTVLGQARDRLGLSSQRNPRADRTGSQALEDDTRAPDAPDREGGESEIAVETGVAEPAPRSVGQPVSQPPGESVAQPAFQPDPQPLQADRPAQQGQPQVGAPFSIVAAEATDEGRVANPDPTFRAAAGSDPTLEFAPTRTPEPTVATGRVVRSPIDPAIAKPAPVPEPSVASSTIQGTAIVDEVIPSGDRGLRAGTIVRVSPASAADSDATKQPATGTRSEIAEPRPVRTPEPTGASPESLGPARIRDNRAEPTPRPAETATLRPAPSAETPLRSGDATPRGGDARAVAAEAVLRTVADRASAEPTVAVEAPTGEGRPERIGNETRPPAPPAQGADDETLQHRDPQQVGETKVAGRDIRPAESSGTHSRAGNEREAAAHGRETEAARASVEDRSRTATGRERPTDDEPGAATRQESRGVTPRTAIPAPEATGRDAVPAGRSVATTDGEPARPIPAPEVSSTGERPPAAEASAAGRTVDGPEADLPREVFRSREVPPAPPTGREQTDVASRTASKLWTGGQDVQRRKSGGPEARVADRETTVRLGAHDAPKPAFDAETSRAIRRLHASLDLPESRWEPPHRDDPVRAGDRELTTNVESDTAADDSNSVSESSARPGLPSAGRDAAGPSPGRGVTSGPNGGQAAASATPTVGSASTSQAPPVGEPQPVEAGRVDYRALVDSIVARARTVPQNGALEVRFALQPEELGQVLVRIESQGEQMKIRIVAASRAAADALGAGAARLAVQMVDAGFSEPDIDLGYNGSTEEHLEQRRRHTHDGDGRGRTTSRDASQQPAVDTTPERTSPGSTSRLDRVA